MNFISRLSLLLNAAFILLLASCSNHQNNSRKIFHYNESAGISSLDPAFAKNQALMWPVHQLFNTIVEVDSNMKIAPSLAKGWIISNDKKSITFFLRTDVYFHDNPVFANGKGRRMIAADVVYSLKRIIDTSTASPGAWIFNNRLNEQNPFVVINDSVFIINLSKPYLPIFGILSMPYCSVVAKEAVEKYGSDFRRNPVGTGPFCFLAWEEGQSLILKKNDHYFEKDESGKSLPYLDGVKISFMESKAMELLSFQQKKLDFVNDLDVSFKDEMLTKNGNLKKNWQGKIILNKHPYLNTEYLGVLIDSNKQSDLLSPLQQKKIRQAINYSIDRKKMMFYLRNSIGTPANSGFIPLGFPSFDSNLVKGYLYDPAKARKLIQEAGYNENNPMPSIKLFTVPAYGMLGTYIVNELNQQGIKSEVEIVQKSLLLDQMSSAQVPFFRGSWIADYPDPTNYLDVFYSKNPAPPNYTRYSNPVYDRFYEMSLQEDNDSMRYILFRKMDSIIVEDSPVIPLWYDMVMQLVQPNIKNFYPNSINMLDLRRVIKQ